MQEIFLKLVQIQTKVFSTLKLKLKLKKNNPKLYLKLSINTWKIPQVTHNKTLEYV